jgi:ABC-type transporter Mla subunit MlaD
MTERNRNALVGFFVLGGLLCFGILLVWFGESKFHFLGKGYTLQIRFNTVSGVREGTEVRLAGVPCGRVLSVDLKQAANPTEGVIANVEVRPKFSIPSGWIAYVETPLMGQAVINILPPTGRIATSMPAPAVAFLPRTGAGVMGGEVVNPLEKLVSPEFLASLEKTTAQIGTLAEALTPAANAITNLLEPRPTSEVENPASRGLRMANLSTAIEQLYNVLKHMDAVLGDPESQQNLKVTLANFRVASEEAKAAVAGFKAFSGELHVVATQASGVLDNVNGTVTVTRESIDALGRRLLMNTDQLSKLLDQLIATGQNLNHGEGTVPMLMHDPKLYEELMLTTRRLGAAAEELRVLIKQWQKGGILSAP